MRRYARAITVVASIGIPSVTWAEAPTVEIQVNDSATLEDDYVTWGPTKCRIRISPLFSAASDLRVVLTNDVTEAPPGRLQPLDGDVSFAEKVTAGETAQGPKVSLALPRNGDWVSFVIAGCFPDGAPRGRSSSKDKDTVIEVHSGSEDGTVIGRHRLMVRVRKNLVNLTDHEKHRLVSAIARLHQEGKYEKFVEVHDWAARGDMRHLGRINHPSYSYPDAAHRGSNFLPWHRIDLLQFERELQKIYPDVSVHYWKLDEGDPDGIVFAPDLYGANEVDMDNPPVLNRTPYLDFVRFSSTNPLHGWRITYQGRFANPELLTRWPVDRKRRPWLLGTPNDLPGEIEVLAENRFVFFSDFLESDTHNKSHHWIGPPMRDCTVAPADPFFWSFHSWFDRVWAKWQRKYDRFAVDGSNDSYEPVGQFNSASGTHAKGHYLDDTMWPWDGVTGKGTHSDPGIRYRQSRPPNAPLGPFPESQIDGIWPRVATKPRVKDAIDYQGIDPAVLSHGYCYDDIRFGKPSQVEVELEIEEDARRKERYARAAKTFADTSATREERVGAASELRSGYVLQEEELRLLMSLLREESDGVVKADALRLLSSPASTRKDAVAYALAELNSGEVPVRFQMMTLNILNNLTHFSPRDVVEADSLHAALRSAASPGRDTEVRNSAVRTLAAQGDTGAISMVREAHRAALSMGRAEAARVLSVDGGGFREHQSLLARELADRNPASLLTVLLASEPEGENVAMARGLVSSPAEPTRVRLAAIHMLSTRDDFAATVVEWIGNPSIPTDLKREALALLHRREISAEDVDRMKKIRDHLSPSLQADMDELIQAAGKGM